VSWSLHEVIDTLVERLRARPGLDGIQIEDAYPGDEKELKCIWVEDAISFDAVAGMRADKKVYNERYTLNVWCDVFSEGGDLSTARQDLTVLVGEVFDEIAEQPRLTGLPDQYVTARVASWRYFPYIQKLGRGASARIEIQILARRK
jgi:hypothetical protein